MKFSLKLKSTPVVLEASDGTELSYSINELTGAARDAYLDKVSKKTKTNSAGEVTGMSSYEGLYSNLLVHTILDGSGKPVPEATIQAWPASVQKALFDEAQRLNGMDDEADEKKA